jgi:hypothetical protein
MGPLFDARFGYIIFFQLAPLLRATKLASTFDGAPFDGVWPKSSEWRRMNFTVLRAGVAMLTGVFLMATTTALSAQSLPTPSPTASSSPAAAVPDELPTFVAPAGWTPKGALPTLPGAVYVGAWSAPPPNSPADTIALSYSAIPSGKPVTLEAIAQGTEASYKKLVGAKNMVASHVERVCGGMADGWYAENKLAIGTMNVVLEQTIFLGKTRTFVATYARLDTDKEDPAARASLDTICVKGFEKPT